MELTVDVNRDALLSRCLSQIENLRTEIEQERKSRAAADAEVTVFRKENAFLESRVNSYRSKLEDKTAAFMKTQAELDSDKRNLELLQQQLKYARQQLDDRDLTFQQEKQRVLLSSQTELKEKIDQLTSDLQHSEKLRKEAEASKVEIKSKAEHLQLQLGELKVKAEELFIDVQKEKRVWQKAVKDEVEVQMILFKKSVEQMESIIDAKHLALLGRLQEANCRVSSLKQNSVNKSRSEELAEDNSKLKGKMLELIAAIEEKDKAYIELRGEFAASQAALIRCQSNREGAIQTSQNLYESLQEKDSVLRKKEERLLACEADLEKMKQSLLMASKETVDILHSSKAKYTRRMQKQHAKYEAEVKRKIEQIKLSYEDKLEELKEQLNLKDSELKLEKDARSMLEEELEQAETKYSNLSRYVEQSTRRSTAINSQHEIERIYVKHRKDTELFTDEFRRKDEELDRIRKLHNQRITTIERTYNEWRERLITESNYMKDWLEKLRQEEFAE
eukprot:CAMPEP_0204898958 /NCGR_PEP_ID=MMETSP1397-20131031/1576_1 /ASSEMBLY_ACC=CAM_ASM_000891 /TAXON_ID=49980 /ORGANISM="Climacostomum Climacostomum virens, Strain Stock W-24" /LENGTH=504 /DNA_ID=CAMNT_0052066859 /DNA_START=3358 /DNA_END=4872 /DNA_ORIENTATION=+